MPQNESTKERQALGRRRKARQILGAVVCILVLLGLVSVVQAGIVLVQKAFDDTDEKKAFETQISFLVALDPLPFDTLEQADQGTLLSASIWERVSQTADINLYEHDETGALYLPVADVAQTAVKLYGSTYQFTYETFENAGLTYTYVPEKKAYLVPVTSAANGFVPTVVSIKREGQTKRVTVAYRSQFGANGAFVVDWQSQEPSKYYDYIFTKAEGGYFLSAIVTSEMKANTPVASSSAIAIAEDPQLALQETLNANSVEESVLIAANNRAAAEDASAPASSSVE